MSSLLFESYRATEEARDEWKGGVPGVERTYGHIEAVLSGRSPAEIERLTRRAHEFMREQGITFNVYNGAAGAAGDRASVERILPFDLFPLTIPANEWAQLQAGLSQRVRAWNLFLRDLYGAQEILRAGVLPYEIIYSDPRYLRECVGIKVIKDIYIHVAAIDLFRNSLGQWLVFEDHLSNATGASYALQNRRSLSQLCPELLEGQNVTPVHHYGTQLLETLLSVTPTGRSNSRAVLLSPGTFNEAYYDHSTLARQMGIPLVQGGDLIVLDNHVYLKTIAGLERVEVIYRRLDSDFVDPITFRSDSLLGVPGLVSCVRKGTVTIANALGADIADNRALHAYIPGIIEFYLNERMLLPSVATWVCRDVDVREQVYGNWDRHVVKEVVSRSPQSVWVGKDLDGPQRKELQAKIEADPGAYIAQPLIQFSTAPTWTGSSLEPRHVGIRAFVLNNGTPLVTPCVLTRYAHSADSLVISSGAGGGSKDTWILRGAHREGEVEVASSSSGFRDDAERMPLGSRSADSLYWIGRYAERAEGTTRLLRVIQQLRLEGEAFQDPRSWQPLWEALATATGHPTSFFKKATIQKNVALAQYVLLDEENPASTLSCLRFSRQNAHQIREALPPEVWATLNGLCLELFHAAEQKATAFVQERLQSLSLQDRLLAQLDELSGCVEKHMLHDEAWHFWQIGRYLERALFTALTMRQVFLKGAGIDDSRPGSAAAAGEDYLDALLRMLAGQYAYRSSYRRRPVPSHVAKLLIQDAEFPRSIVFCLDALKTSLQAVFGEKKGQAKAKTDTPLHYCHHLVSELMFADVAAYFPAPVVGEDGVERPASPTQQAQAQARAVARNRAKAFDEWTQNIISRLFNLGNLVSDHYLNHQAATPMRSYER
ncbi:MAG TPA: circularly permuted type 2 ATP-grasp protein [Candidatus Methylacidiphilales bacterium]